MPTTNTGAEMAIPATAESDAVEEPVALERREGAGRDPEHQREESRRADQLQCPRQASAISCATECSSSNEAPRSPRERRKVAQILRRERPVEAEPFAQLRHRRRIGRDAAGGEQQFRRVAGHQVDRHEHNGGDHPDQEEATPMRRAAQASPHR